MTAAVNTAIAALHPYQPGKPVEELARERGVTDIVKLASNENPRGPGPLVRKALEAGVGELSRYPDGNGFRLKAALAEHHRIAPEQITPRQRFQRCAGPGRPRGGLAGYVRRRGPTLLRRLSAGHRQRERAGRARNLGGLGSRPRRLGRRRGRDHADRLHRQPQQSDRNFRGRHGHRGVPRPGAGKRVGGGRRGLCGVPCTLPGRDPPSRCPSQPDRHPDLLQDLRVGGPAHRLQHQFAGVRPT